MSYVVFAQRPEPSVDVVAILQNARRFFDASVEVLEADPETKNARLTLERPKQNLSGTFWIRARRVEEDDLTRAEQAETRGRAGGMASLAARCPTLWEIEPEGETGELEVLTLAAILASTALGPVMPPDTSTLFGVRGAMERVEKLQKA